ncbi:MAG: antitermination protein NusG, partial [Gammaproteobacteria bacterium]|nr:antitermination protein NusG [Gammaproteobacteria bacterium]
MEFGDLLNYLFRWIHFFAGVAWIGLLYYFNFVQTEYFKEADAAAKASAISKLVPRALWWFRYGALFTFLSGVILAAYLGGAINYYITIGMVLGTLMFLNVWLIIWPNQKVVIASNEQVLG